MFCLRLISAAPEWPKTAGLKDVFSFWGRNHTCCLAFRGWNGFVDKKEILWITMTWQMITRLLTRVVLQVNHNGWEGLLQRQHISLAFSALFILATEGEIHTESIVKEQSGFGNSPRENPCSVPTPLVSALIMNWPLECCSLFFTVLLPSCGVGAHCVLLGHLLLICDVRQNVPWKCMSATDTKAMVLTVGGSKQPRQPPKHVLRHWILLCNSCIYPCLQMPLCLTLLSLGLGFAVVKLVRGSAWNQESTGT